MCVCVCLCVCVCALLQKSRFSSVCCVCVVCSSSSEEEQVQQGQGALHSSNHWIIQPYESLSPVLFKAPCLRVPESSSEPFWVSIGEGGGGFICSILSAPKDGGQTNTSHCRTHSSIVRGIIIIIMNMIIGLKWWYHICTIIHCILYFNFHVYIGEGWIHTWLTLS